MSDMAAAPAYAEPGLVLPGFDAFYAEHYRRAVTIAWALTGSRETAEDLVQDAMADAHRRWGAIGGYDAPEQWLRRAIVNRSVSLRRRLVIRAAGLARLAGQSEPAEGIDARDARLWAIVRRLPNRQGQLVALVFVAGLTIADAADVLGVALPTAKTHLARARRRLALDLASWREPTPDDGGTR